MRGAWFLIALVPFFAIIVISFMEFRGPVMHPNLSLNNFRDLFNQSWRPLINTLILSTAAAILAAHDRRPHRLRHHPLPLQDLGPARRHRHDAFAVAGTVLAIGLIISFNSGWLVLTGGWLILVLAWVVRKIPFNVRASAAILHQIDPSLEEASINLGVSPLMTFVRLTVPLMMGGVIGGMVLTWVTVASELSSTVVLYSGPWATMTVVMFQALEGTGAGIASAAATVLIVFTVLPVALVYRLLRRHELGMM